MTTPSKMSSTFNAAASESGIGEKFSPLSFPETKNRAEIAEGIQKWHRPVAAVDPEGFASSQPLGKHKLAEIGKGAPKSRSWTKAEHADGYTSFSRKGRDDRGRVFNKRMTTPEKMSTTVNTAEFELESEEMFPPLPSRRVPEIRKSAEIGEGAPKSPPLTKRFPAPVTGAPVSGFKSGKGCLFPVSGTGCAQLDELLREITPCEVPPQLWERIVKLFDTEWKWMKTEGHGILR